MSSLDLSVEDHDDYNPLSEGIPERCHCFLQAVLEMHKFGRDAGRMIYRCSHKDRDKGGHLAKFFDEAVHQEFVKVRIQIQQLRRVVEADMTEASRVSELEAANNDLREEVRNLREEIVKDRRKLGLVLRNLGNGLL